MEEREGADLMAIPEINTVKDLRKALVGIPGSAPVRVKVWHYNNARSLRDVQYTHQGADDNLEPNTYLILSTY